MKEKGRSYEEKEDRDTIKRKCIKHV